MSNNAMSLISCSPQATLTIRQSSSILFLTVNFFHRFVLKKNFTKKLLSTLTDIVIYHVSEVLLPFDFCLEIDDFEKARLD